MCNIENMEKQQNVDIQWLKIVIATTKIVIEVVHSSLQCVKRSACIASRMTPNFDKSIHFTSVNLTLAKLASLPIEEKKCRIHVCFDSVEIL